MNLDEINRNVKTQMIFQLTRKKCRGQGHVYNFLSSYGHMIEINNFYFFMEIYFLFSLNN